MIRADTGNFNRFLTSLGLAALVAALVIPYFFFRDTDVLRIPQGELVDLTPAGRHSLETRQQRIGDLEAPVIGLAAVLALAGVSALFAGGRRLRIAQTKEDEAVERRAQREDYEIRQLSSAELEEKQDEQVRETVDEETAAAAPADEIVERTAPNIPPLQVDEEGLAVPTVRLRTVSETKKDIARIESEMHRVLQVDQFNKFAYRASVKIVPEGSGPTADISPRQVNVDGLFESQEPYRPDVALELKVTRLSVRSLKSRTRFFTDPLLALLTRYEQVTGKDVVGWLLILIPRDAEQLESRERHYVEKHFEQGLAGLGRCLVLHEQDLDQLPQLFRAVFD